MKIYGEGILVDAKDECIRFARELGLLDAVTVGAMSPGERSTRRSSWSPGIRPHRWPDRPLFVVKHQVIAAALDVNVLDLVVGVAAVWR